LTAFVLDGPASAAYAETVVLSHSAWSKEYRVVRNVIKGCEARLEDDSVVEFEYYPLAVRLPVSRSGLALDLTVELGDLGEVVPSELDRVRESGRTLERPVLTYRAFRSDALLDGPIVGPWRLEVYSVAVTAGLSVLSARTRASSPARTGLTYTRRLFPTLRVP
jgi:hypothetical protein